MTVYLARGQNDDNLITDNPCKIVTTGFMNIISWFTKHPIVNLLQVHITSWAHMCCRKSSILVASSWLFVFEEYFLITLERISRFLTEGSR